MEKLGMAGIGQQRLRAARWEHFAHGADIGVRGIGRTREEAFEQAALAMTAVITDPEQVEQAVGVEVDCEAPDDELLLVDWLNVLVYQMSTRRLLFGRFQVKIEDHRLHGSALGEPVDVAKHEPAVEIKGATLTCLAVREEPRGTYVAQCVVDV